MQGLPFIWDLAVAGTYRLSVRDWLNVYDNTTNSPILPAVFSIKIRPCQPGERQDFENSQCQQCQPGEFSNTTSATACTTCPNGTYAARAGLSKVVPPYCTDGCTPEVRVAVLLAMHAQS